jgi:mannose-6-phosphate isomerase-like protein (cupin superfamily)
MYPILKAISIQNAEHYQWGQRCDGWHLHKAANFSIIQERVPSGSAEVWHYHERAEQFFYVLSGTATLTTDDATVQLQAGEGCHVPAKVPHQLHNEGKEPLEFLVISVPMAHGDRVLLSPSEPT